MKKIVRITESELVKLVKKVLNEQWNPASVNPSNLSSSNTSSDWDKVKNYLLTKGFPPDFPNKGVYSTHWDEEVDLYNDKFNLSFRKKDNKVSVWARSRSAFDSSRTRTWSWDGTKPIINGGYQPLGVTKGASGYAKTEDDILTKNKILGLGSQGDLVKKVQFRIYFDYDMGQPGGCKVISGHNFDSSWQTCDGIYGKKTKELVKKIQNFLELKGKDGNVGKETWDALFG